jgi:pyridoxine 5'-phosphate synthase PdxJ
MSEWEKLWEGVMGQIEAQPYVVRSLTMKGDWFKQVKAEGDKLQEKAERFEQAWIDSELIIDEKDRKLEAIREIKQDLIECIETIYDQASWEEEKNQLLRPLEALNE